MKTKICVVIGVFGLGLLITFAVSSRLGVRSADAAAIAAQFDQLAQEYDRRAELQDKALEARNDEEDGLALADETLSDEEWLKRGPSADPTIPDPDATLLPRFLEFAEKYASSPLAFDALFFIIRRGGPQTGDVHGKPWQLKEQALDVVWANHSHDLRIVHLFESLSGSFPSQKTEAFLKRAMESGRDRAVRAAAALNLARYYHSLAKSHKRSGEIATKPQLKNFERYWKIVVSPHLANFPIDQNKNFDEIDKLLASVVEEFADVPAIDWKLSGPARVYIESVPFTQPMLYADQARAMLFEVNNIVPGKPAPEIVGSDADGKQFRLSDYRGKVVLLTFSADWCGICVGMYPIHRNLVEKYRDRPFALLSVSRDEAVDTLKSSSTSGQITWRCWWDGREGPINRAWNNGGIPDLYLLDHEHIIQDVALARYTTQAEFEQAIEPLLEKAAHLATGQ